MTANRLALPAFCALTIVLLSAPAHGQSPSQEAAEAYFHGENVANGVYTGVGAAGIGLGIYLTTSDDPLANGAGYPLIAIGAIQLGTGVGFLIYSALKRPKVLASLRKDEPRGLAAERERIDGAVGSFPIYKIMEGAAAVAGLSVALTGLAESDRQLTGVGVGLLIGSLVQLCLEFASQDVTYRYEKALAQLPTVSISPFGIAISTTW